MLEEALKIVKTLRNMRDPTEHTRLMISGIERIASIEAKQHLASLTAIVEGCESNYLKRLEAEARLVQSGIHLVITELGAVSDYDIDASLSKIGTLCQTYPDTAGLLMSTYIAMRTAARGGQRQTNIYKARDIWWSWPKYNTGSLTWCSFGHPYSGEMWSDCPDCGREVVKTEAANPQKFLKEMDFMAAMSKQSFDCSKWRK